MQHEYHIFAINVGGVIYRDDRAMPDAEFAIYANAPKGLPRDVMAYHQHSTDWEVVMQLPIWSDPECLIDSLRTLVDIFQSEHGACRRCERVPAAGLFRGVFVDYRRTVKDGSEYALLPYRGYICEQCAQEAERGSWQ